MATTRRLRARPTLRGGEWLLQSTDADSVFTPERLTDEHRLIGQTAQEFVDNEVLPVLDRSSRRTGRSRASSSSACGELGLLGVDVPEAYGGVGLDKVTLARRQREDGAVGVVRRHLRRAGQPDHRCRSSLFGTEAQKQKYLPRLLSRRDRRRLRPERVGLGIRRARREDHARRGSRRQLRAERREDVDHQRRLRRPLHRLRQGRRRAVHGASSSSARWRREERQGRAQDGPARLVDDAADPPGRAGAGREPARRDRQGPQGRVQRAELRALQARRDVRRRRARRHRRERRVRGRRARSSASRSRRSAPSSTSSARWSSAPTRSRACSIAPPA